MYYNRYQLNARKLDSRQHSDGEKEYVSMSEEIKRGRQQSDDFSFSGNWPFAEEMQSYSTPTMYRTISGSLPGGRKLIRPLRVEVEYEDGEVIVSEPRFHMHAVAPTEAEGINAFKRIFSGYLDSLTRREKTLGPQLYDQLNYLRSMIASE